MNSKALIILSFFIGAIISKKALNEDDFEIDLVPGEEKTIENPIYDSYLFYLPLKKQKNEIAITIPKVEHKIEVEYCGLKEMSISDFLECENRGKKVELNEKEEGETFNITGNFSLSTGTYKYVALEMSKIPNELKYFKIKVDQNVGTLASISFIIFTTLLSFL